MSENLEPRVTLIMAVLDSLQTQPEYEARAYVGNYESKDDDLEFFQGIIATALDGTHTVVPEASEHGIIYRFVEIDHA